MLSLPLLSMSPMSSFPPNPPLWSHTLQIIPSLPILQRSSGGLWMALISLLILLLPSMHAITTTKVGLTECPGCNYITWHFCYILVAWRECLMGGSFMMHTFMTCHPSWQVLPADAGIPSVMHLMPFCGVRYHLWGGKVVVCSMY